MFRNQLLLLRAPRGLSRIPNAFPNGTTQKGAFRGKSREAQLHRSEVWPNHTAQRVIYQGFHSWRTLISAFSLRWGCRKGIKPFYVSQVSMITFPSLLLHRRSGTDVTHFNATPQMNQERPALRGKKTFRNRWPLRNLALLRFCPRPRRYQGCVDGCERQGSKVKRQRD